MPKSFQKIMLVTNEPANSAGAEKTALNLAKQNGASIVVVDTVKTPFVASRYPTLSSDFIYDMAIDSKEKYLAKIQKQFAEQGINSTTKVLVGPRTSSELINTSDEQHCDLVVRYLKGQSSREGGRYGETAGNLLRACSKPVLLTEKEISDPRVLACINLDHGPEENQAILDNARRLVSESKNLLVLACWEFTGNEYLIDFVGEGIYEQTKQEASIIYRKLFECFHSEYDLEDLEDQVHLINQNPVITIPTICKEHSIDVAVMCSASLNHPLGRKLGSTGPPESQSRGDVSCGKRDAQAACRLPNSDAGKNLCQPTTPRTETDQHNCALGVKKRSNEAEASRANNFLGTNLVPRLKKSWQIPSSFFALFRLLIDPRLLQLDSVGPLLSIGDWVNNQSFQQDYDQAFRNYRSE